MKAAGEEQRNNPGSVELIRGKPEIAERNTGVLVDAAEAASERIKQPDEDSLEGLGPPKIGCPAERVLKALSPVVEFKLRDTIAGFARPVPFDVSRDQSAYLKKLNSQCKIATQLLEQAKQPETNAKQKETKWERMFGPSQRKRAEKLLSLWICCGRKEVADYVAWQQQTWNLEQTIKCSQTLYTKQNQRKRKRARETKTPSFIETLKLREQAADKDAKSDVSFFLQAKAEDIAAVIVQYQRHQATTMWKPVVHEVFRLFPQEREQSSSIPSSRQQELERERRQSQLRELDRQLDQKLEKELKELDSEGRRLYKNIFVGFYSQLDDGQNVKSLVDVNKKPGLKAMFQHTRRLMIYEFPTFHETFVYHATDNESAERVMAQGFQRQMSAELPSRNSFYKDPVLALWNAVQRGGEKEKAAQLTLIFTLISCPKLTVKPQLKEEMTEEELSALIQKEETWVDNADEPQTFWVSHDHSAWPVAALRLNFQSSPTP